MGRGTWLHSVIIAAIGISLQVASLAVTCGDHWALPTAHQHHHTIPLSSDRAPHDHSDGSPHNHEQCSVQGMPGVFMLVLPSLDCLCDLSGLFELIRPALSAQAPLLDDPFYERISLTLPFKPPIPS